MNRSALNRIISVVALVFGGLLVAGAAWGLLYTPEPHVLTCERLPGTPGTPATPGEIACEPGNVHGPSAAVRKNDPKSSRDCFVLGTTWLCGGDSGSAAAKVNALTPGAKATIDVSAPPARLSEVGFAGLFGLAMVIVAVRKLRA